MKAQLVIISISLFLCSIFAKEAELIALLPMGGSGIEENQLIEIANGLRSEINKSEHLEVVDRMPMLHCLRNNGVVEGGTCDELNCAFLMGEFLSLRYVIQSRISNSGKSVHINLRVLDIEKKVILKQIEEGCVGNIALVKSKLLPKIAKKIGQIRFAGRQFHIAQKDENIQHQPLVKKVAQRESEKTMEPVKVQKAEMEVSALSSSPKVIYSDLPVKLQPVLLTQKSEISPELLRDSSIKTLGSSAVKNMI
jgi:hypothetical protein